MAVCSAARDAAAADSARGVVHRLGVAEDIQPTLEEPAGSPFRGIAAANLAVLALLIFPFAVLTARRVPRPFSLDPHKWPALLGYGLP